MATAIQPKRLRKGGIAVVALCGALYFVPFLTLFFLITGLFDVLRNERQTRDLFERYFSGNGFTTWMLSPLNLALDLTSYPNKKIYSLEDFSPDAREEIEAVLSVFLARKQEIIAQVDRSFESGRRAMFLYRWFGRRYNQDIAEFNRPFKHIQTIAVSVFQGKEATGFHFGPFRATMRVLYNLTPVERDDVFVECGQTRHYWHQNPLFIFDDTLMHRSVNEHDARRYCVFVDVIRPSPVTGLLCFLLVPISTVTHLTKGIFYKHWRMLGADGAARNRTVTQRPL